MAKETVLAACFQDLPTPDQDQESLSLPEWLPILPGGEVIRGRDGRAWRNPDPVAVLRRLSEQPPLVLDENHSTQLKAPRGEESPLLAQIRSYRMESDGSIWGQFDWTDLGREKYKGYRHLSPAILHDGNDDGETRGAVLGLESVGLVNQGNLDMVALNREHSEDEDKKLEISKETLTKLGLSEDATQEQLDARLEELDAATADSNAAKGAVPAKGEPTLAELKARLDDLEKSQETALNSAKTAHDQAAETAINAFTREGKIRPDEASQKFARKQCETPDGLKAFCDYYKQAAPLVSTNAQGAPAGDIDNTKGGKLTERQKALCRQLNVSEEDFVKYNEVG